MESMDPKQLGISEEYQKYFDPRDFREFKVGQLKTSKWLKKYDFWITSLYEFLISEKFTGRRLLDLASGPTPYNMATASFYFSDIILSDYVEGNRQELWKWLKKEPGFIDWTPFFERVAIAENRQNLKEACKEMEDRIRSTVKDVVYCDVLSEGIVPEDIRREPFDLVLSSLTLENSIADWDSYSKSLKCIRGLLKKGGKLVMMSLLKCDGYAFGGHRFHFLKLDKDQIDTALNKSGYVDIRWKIKEQPEDTEIPYFVCATSL